MSEREIATLEAKLNFMQENFSRIEVLIQKHIEQEDMRWSTILEKLDNKYASKWVERLVFGLVGLILTGVVGALGALLIK